jgi:hypothetical protein
MKKIADPGKEGHKKKTNQDNIHKKANSRPHAGNRAGKATSGEYAHWRVGSSREEIGE